MNSIILYASVCASRRSVHMTLDQGTAAAAAGLHIVAGVMPVPIEKHTNDSHMRMMSMTHTHTL